MKTYSGVNAGSTLEPTLWNARRSIWITSPWIGNNYARQLASLSQNGVEVRIITSNVDYNTESLRIFRASENSNLMLLVVDRQTVGFIHSKVYIIDHSKAFCGSANLTFSGLNSNHESMSIAETPEEIQQIEHGFMKTWMDFERKAMSKDELRFEKAIQIKNALPLAVDYGTIDYPNIKGKGLLYYPYYYFEYSFRTTVGKSPSIVFEDRGFILVDSITRRIINDELLIEAIEENPIRNYSLRPKNKYTLEIREAKIRNFHEAKELAIDYIRELNTKDYKQYYRNRTYVNKFIPYPSIIRFIRSGFVQMPLWYIERHEDDGRKHVNIVLGTSGKKWGELLICPECEKKVWIKNSVKCQNCGIEVCSDCIKKVGLIFKKQLCTSCYHEQ